MSDVKYDTEGAAVSVSPDIPAQTVYDEPVKVKKPRGKIIRRIITLIIVLALILGALYVIRRRRTETVQTGPAYSEYTVGTRDITLNLSGTGSLSPADSYTVTTLISGEILSSPFEEGDVVEKDTTLYTVDSSDVSTSIEQAQNSLAQARRSHDQKVKSLEDLNITASETGTVIEMLVEPGDNVTTGQTVARIRNSAVMSLVVPFGSDDADSLYVGQNAEVILEGTFERIAGTISKISVFEERLEGNMLVKYVTIDVKNPGAIVPEQIAAATVGDIACTGSGTFSYKGENTVTASMSGEVSEIFFGEGDTVTKGDLFIVLSSQSLQNEILNSESSLRDSELSLENRYGQLNNYTITSPISGTIIEKNYKEGDNLESGKALCTIFDLSYLTMTLNVDELDIASVAVGQEVTVTAEALPDRVYSGYVTKVNINGTTSNGVTSYPVTIRIDETEGLLPGMNVQASIIVSQSKDTVAIPVSALSRGNRVLVKTDSSSAQGFQRPDGAQMTEGAEMPEGFQRADGAQMTEGAEMPEGFQRADGAQRPDGGQMPEGAFRQEGSAAIQITAGSDIPEGYTYVQVTPGISDDDYIEILDGLKAGDIIAVAETVIPDSTGFFGMGSVGRTTGQVTTVAPAGGGPAYSERTVVVGR